MLIKISNLFNLESDLETFKPDYILSMLDPCIEKSRIPKFTDYKNVVQLFFYDEDDLDKQQISVAAFLDKIIVYFNEILAAETDAKLLIHCHAGASRSPAAAYIFFMMMLGEGREKEAFLKMLEITNKPWPNKYLIELAEKQLNRPGLCLPYIEEYQAKNPNRYKAYVRFNKKRKL